MRIHIHVEPRICGMLTRKVTCSILAFDPFVQRFIIFSDYRGIAEFPGSSYEAPTPLALCSLACSSITDLRESVVAVGGGCEVFPALKLLLVPVNVTRYKLIGIAAQTQTHR